MAVDSGWIVAGSSLATIIVTGLFGIWSKRIDAKQKVNEHKLTIRGTYVSKKLEVGQIFIGKTMLRQNEVYAMYGFYKNLQEEKKPSDKHFALMKEMHDANDALATEKTSFTAAFFDVIHITKKRDALIYKMNTQKRLVNNHLGNIDEAGWSYTDDFDADITKLLLILDELQKVHDEMNATIRDNLAKYDVI